MSAMSDTDDGPEHTITDLRRMDEATAKQELTYGEYQRWESANEHLDEYEETVAEWDETRAEATDIMVRADVSDLAADVTVFGNDLSVYYAPDDDRMRELGEELGEAFGVDIEEVGEEPDAVEDLSTDDLDDGIIDDVTDLLADLICHTIQSWDGHDWDDLGAPDRKAVRDVITDDPPQGWGVAGAMDAWVEIATAVEAHRDERMERIQKFRSPERRGDR